MTSIVSFSGGKDSTALILWAKENLDNFITVYCDTGWESPITTEYINYINHSVLEDKLITLKSKKYNGFKDLCIKKKRVPSVLARYCTEELKLKPMANYIQHLSDVEVYVGVRADESIKRSKLPERSYADIYQCDIVRPLLKWSAEDVFKIHKRYGITPNPLYKVGMKRVGCFPCIMSSHLELVQIFKRFPEVIENIREIETAIGKSFFSAGTIPDKYCSGYDTKSEKYFPWIDDVKKYIINENQIGLFDEGESCMSYYSICE